MITTKDREPKVGETFGRCIDGGECFDLKRISDHYAEVVNNRAGPGYMNVGSIISYAEIQIWFSTADFIIIKNVEEEEEEIL